MLIFRCKMILTKCFDSIALTAFHALVLNFVVSGKSICFFSRFGIT